MTNAAATVIGYAIARRRVRRLRDTSVHGNTSATATAVTALRAREIDPRANVGAVLGE